MSSSMAGASASGYSAGAMIPVTRSFVQSTAGTTQYTLVGQVLYNGQTNWVGYNQGSADYLMTSSAANAQQTTLDDGNTYYVSQGKPPAGYLAGVTMTAMSSDASETAASASMSSDSDTAAATASNSDSSPSSSSSDDDSSSGSPTGSAAATTSSPSSGHRLATGAVFTLVIGLIAAASINFVA